MGTLRRRPRLSVSFARFGNRDYVLLAWGHGGPPALSLEIERQLDDERRTRIEAAVAALLLEIGDV